jgi:arginyl-tRNA synthetase
MLRFRGHEVVPQNHLGDWGTPFGMLIEHMLDDDRGSPGQGDYSVSDLNAFYQQARTRFDADPDFRERARGRLVDLQRGDPETDALWRRLVAESERHFAEVYELLDVELTHDDLAPESMYHDRLAAVVEEFDQKGLTVESDGATVVFLPGFVGRTGDPIPLILRKSDGGYTYDTTDLAAIRYRIHDLGAGKLLYVVGVPQRLHLQMVFEAARAAGWLTDDIEALHVGFGSVLGEDGKMLRTRAGGAVRLVELLREAIERAAGLLEDRPELDDDDRRRLARAVGIGAVKYADLSTDRERDYVFSFERMLSLDGNTSVYLQYANARARSVLARASSRPGDEMRFQLVEEAERMLALRLLRLPAAVRQTLADMRPNKLCNYLYDLAVTFSTFYETCPVLAAPSDELRYSRLALCELTSRTLETGLGLLGIAAPEQL